MIPAPRIPWWTALALTGAGVLMLAVFLAPRTGLPVRSRPEADRAVLRVAHAWPLVVDPHHRSFPMPAQNHFTLSLWEPLIECDPATGLPEPAAAASWRWSPDRLTLTVTLRADGRWSNGEPVTAEDFVRGWRRLVAQGVDSAAVIFPVKNAMAVQAGKLPDTALGVEAVDDLTLRITLETVRSTFVAELADPLFVPLHATTAGVLKDRLHLTAPEKLITNGAFRLVRADAESLRLGASPHYRDRAAVRLAGVEFIRADDAGMARLLVAVGRADVASAPPRSGAGVPTTRPLQEASELALGVISLDFNTARGPLRDVRVRRALSLAVDREAFFAEVDAGRRVPAYSWVPDMPGRPALKVLRGDAAEARRLLAEAGYPGGDGFPVLILPVDPDRENFAYYQAWVECWHRELGVRTYLAFAPLARRWRRIERGDFDVKVSGLVATVPDAGDLLSIFAFPERFGLPQWSNPEIVRLMTEADRRSGPQRLAILEQLERQVLDEVLTIPMMFESRRTLLAAEVEGWYPDPLGRQALRRLALRPVETASSRREEPL